MKKRIIQSLLLAISLAGLCTTCYSTSQPFIQMVNTVKTVNAIEMIDKANVTIEPAKTIAVRQSEEEIQEVEQTDKVISEPLVFPDSYYDPNTEEYREEEFWDDMELIALVCVAEAEGESEYGKRLVIDTILNRLDSEYFPNDIKEIVYAPNQYQCISNGRINRVEYNEYIANLVMEEYHNRTNSDVLYFKTESFFSFAKPIVHEGNHYFSGRY